MSSWRDEFTSYIQGMDREHKQCLDLSDLLLDALDSKQDSKLVGIIFDNLVGNIYKHFISEELLMKDYSYPLLNQHENEHKKFIEYIAEIRTKILNNEIILTKEIITKIQVSFSKHVLNADNEFVIYFNDRNKVN